jgi:hypothetical protein
MNTNLDLVTGFAELWIRFILFDDPQDQFWGTYRGEGWISQLINLGYQEPTTQIMPDSKEFRGTSGNSKALV